jgi:hypothetical protein
MERMETWNKLKQPPISALKKIAGGRLAGKTDINPQWRYQAMTEVFGVCGRGWKYTIDKLWTEPAPAGEVFAFAQISVYIREDSGEWSAPIPGIGGSMLVESEKSGLHSNDEAYKMATTDALSVALKMLGVAADIYAGKFDGSKYDTPEEKKKPDKKAPANKEPDVPMSPGASAPPGDKISEDQGKRMYAISQGAKIPTESLKLFLMHFYGFEHSKDITKAKYKEICEILMDRAKFDPIMKTISK